MGCVNIPADLDPDDAVRREHLIDELRAAREALGLSRSDLADLLGVTTPNIHAIEKRTTWQARTIARYARALRSHIEWFLDDLELPDDGDVMAVIIAAGDTSTPERADRVAWRGLCNDLVRIRRATCSAVEMGRRLGIHENTVHHWEANPDGSSVIAAQRHARGLAGRLSWRLHTTAVTIAAQREVA
jgi:DNA-binding XRE family transcriptional regulator